MLISMNRHCRLRRAAATKTWANREERWAAAFIAAAALLLVFKPIPAHGQSAPAQSSATAVKVLRRDSVAYDLWTVGCAYLSQPADSKSCTASLPVRRPDSQQLLVVLTVGPDGRGERRIQATVPTSTMVQDGVTVRFEPAGEIKLPILSCYPAACLASVLYDQANAALMASATKAEVTWTNAASGRVKVEFAVNGAKQALAALSQ